jgi:hypothetical protein
MTLSRLSRENLPGLSAGGSGPRVHRHRRPKPGVWSSRTPRAPDARRGQSWHRRLSRSAKRTKATAASNLDTLLGRGNDREVRMLLSFQRPSHLFKKGFPSQGRIQEPSGSRSGPVSIAPKSRAVGGPRSGPLDRRGERSANVRTPSSAGRFARDRSWETAGRFATIEARRRPAP